MPKTIEEMFDEKQKTIKEAIKGKSKTEISIGLRWAINCAVAFVPEKDKGTAKGFRLIEKWYEKFMDLDRNYMLENMPIEITEQPRKLTGKDFAIAKEEAPKIEALQEQAENFLGAGKIKEDEQEKDEMTTIPENEQLPIIQEEKL